MPTKEEGYGIAAGGRIIHELGTTRMGKNPARSVVDPDCRVHGVPNLFVADGGPFVSQADKNPTWTIMALAVADQRPHRASSGRRVPCERPDPPRAGRARSE